MSILPLLQMGCPPSIAEQLADERWSQAVLDFLATTDVGRIGPPVADEEEDAASEASEWEAWEQDWERREEERLGHAW